MVVGVEVRWTWPQLVLNLLKINWWNWCFFILNWWYFELRGQFFFSILWKSKKTYFIFYNDHWYLLFSHLKHAKTRAVFTLQLIESMELKNAERLTYTGQWRVEKYPLKLNLGKWSSSSNSAQLLALRTTLPQSGRCDPARHTHECLNKNWHET